MQQLVKLNVSQLVCYNNSFTAVSPRNFCYNFQLGPLVYMLSQKSTPNLEGSTQAYSGLLYAVITMVLPYAIMVSTRSNHNGKLE